MNSSRFQPVASITTPDSSGSDARGAMPRATPDAHRLSPHLHLGIRPAEPKQQPAMDVLASLKSQRHRSRRGLQVAAFTGTFALMAFGMATWWFTAFPTGPRPAPVQVAQPPSTARSVEPAAQPKTVADHPAPATPPRLANANPAEPNPALAQHQTEELLRSRLESWRQAWSVRDVDAYLAHYGAGFKPAKEPSRNAWASSRRRVISSRSDIQLTLSQMRFQRMDDQHWNVEFLQDYASGGYVEKQLAKSLTWGLEDGQWVIVSERQSR